VCQVLGTITSILLLLTVVAGAVAAQKTAWGTFAKKPDNWYRSDEGRRIAENILSWQSAEGAWPKNQDNTKRPFVGDRKRIKGTFDNGATTDELRFLARAFRATQDPRCQEAFLKGEWRLHKAELAQPGGLAANIALGMIAEFVARRVEPRVFVLLAFYGAGFASAGALGDQIGGQNGEQCGPQLPALFLRTGLRSGVGEMA
jgi:hypothetical protein